MNKYILGDVAQLTLVALQQASLRLTQVVPVTDELYHGELKYIRQKTGQGSEYQL